MHDLIAITPLGSDVARQDRVGALTLTEVPDWALASVAARPGQEDACHAALTAFLGATLPGPGHAVAGGAFGAFWTGPEQWMIEASYTGHQDLAGEVKAVVGKNASVTDQGDGWCRFDLVGEGLNAVLERLCNLDLSRMGSGSASRTAIEHMGCFVVFRSAGASVSVIGGRSAAGSLHHAILTAMRAVP
ncbi:MAG: sarcosine oxidase subunit gamma [Rhodobacteraceae bacterium CG17_big_fil_post_rev_8_21_14_2_50_63_15]|nr:MAG: sarcosine oxidase subunit gamma [Rhodobacteraceae bacterium CG17_big_fil_post_rev_8_21_14_2_50_63_15]